MQKSATLRSSWSRCKRDYSSCRRRRNSSRSAETNHEHRYRPPARGAAAPTQLDSLLLPLVDGGNGSALTVRLVQSVILGRISRSGAAATALD